MEYLLWLLAAGVILVLGVVGSYAIEPLLAVIQRSSRDTKITILLLVVLPVVVFFGSCAITVLTKLG